MPAVIPVHVAIRETLKDSVGHAITLDSRLELLIAERPSRPSGNFHGKIDFSSPPWHAPVAHCHFDLHALSRKLERDLRSELNLPRRYRGGSSSNTPKALHAVNRLAQGADDFIVRLSTKELEKWSRRASIALELTEAPKKLPRLPKEPERPCPWCKNRTLRILPLKGEIYCVNPACKDEEGRKPKASLEYSSIANDLVLIWQDNLIGTP
jgi:hypothetical protein